MKHYVYDAGALGLLLAGDMWILQSVSPHHH